MEDYPHGQSRDCTITHYRNMAIWISSNINIGQSLNSRDSFPRKFKNRAPTICSPRPILWPPTISFELHAKTAEEIDLEMCSYGQLWEVQCCVTLTLTLDRVKVTSIYTVRVELSSTPNHVTVASPSTEICGHLNVVKYRHSVKFELCWYLS